jgi:hypothetical protein
MPAIVTLKADSKLYLMTEGGVVRAFNTVEEALSYFEVGYNRNHRRSYEGSMSALLNAITYSAAVHRLDYEDISPLIEQGVVDTETFNNYQLNHVSGSMTGALLTGVNAEAFHASGIAPRIIS